MNLPLFVQRHLNQRKPPIKLFWWRYRHPYKHNFGDEISAEIIKKLWNLDCEWTPINECDLVATGSILGMVIRGNTKGRVIRVWGSGFIEPGKVVDNDSFHIYALRGPLTKKRIRKSQTIALGDPGLLANKVYERASEVSHEVGVVVHYADSDAKILDNIRNNPRFFIIDPLQTPEKVAQDISSCRLVFSSSLHGLVFADSFNIPNYWLPFSDRVTGGDYKFRDYYESTGRELVRKHPEELLSGNIDLEKLVSEYCPVHNLSKIQRQLINSFPYATHATPSSIYKKLMTLHRRKELPR